MSELPLPSRDDVPKPLVQVRQWVNWHVTTPNGRKPTKEPCNSSGRPIDAHDAANHLSFNAARSLARRHGLGVGYVLTTEDPYTAFDLDDCITDGTLHPAAWKIVEGCNSYTEVTPSGNGLRIFIEGVKLEGSRSVSTRAPWGGRLEVYSTGRYLTITGQHLEGTPLRIQPAPSFLRSIEQKYLGDGSEPGTGLGTALLHDGTDGARPRHDVLRDAAASMIVKGVPEKAVLAGVIAVGRALGLEKDRGERTFKAECRAAVKSADKFETDYAKELRRQRNRERARRELAAENAGPQFELPEVGRTLADVLAEPRESLRFTVDRLHTEGTNALLVAQYKVGKTTLIGNLVRALADEVPFLDEFDVDFPEGRIAISNYELVGDMLLEWLEDIRIKNTDRIAAPLNLRGRSLRLWDPDVRQRVVDWLAGNDVKFWCVDPAARAWRGLVDREGDNVQIDGFLSALDEIKEQAGVPNLLLSTHMGREKFEEDQERARGGTRLEDWMDNGWYMGKDGPSQDAPRWLRAVVRGGDGFDAQALDWDGGRLRYSISGQTRAERREGDEREKVLRALVMAGRPLNNIELQSAAAVHRNKLKAVCTLLVEERLVREWKKGKPVWRELTEEGVELMTKKGVWRVGDGEVESDG